MADKNINPDAYIPAESEIANQDLDRSVDDITLPLTSNFVAPGGVAPAVTYVQGDVIFQFSTGEDEWIQIPKTFLGVDYAVKSANGGVDTIDTVDKALAPCMWQSARFEIEGQRVATSNNYTFDWTLSNRLQYSADYNKQFNNIRYYANAAYDVNDSKLDEPAAKGDIWSNYTSVDNLSALFFRTENMLLPPNTHYKLTLTPETYETFKQKCSYVDTRAAGAQRNEISISRLYLSLHRVRRTTKPAGDYTLRFMNIESNMSAPAGTVHNIQYQVSSKMRKCGVALVSTAASTEAAAKVFGATRFRYATDLVDTRNQLGTVAGVGNGLYKLQVKSGSLLMPNNIYDFQTRGLKDAYLHYLNSTGKYNDDFGRPESYLEWCSQGPIYVEDSVKGPIDLSTNLQVECLFQAQPVANVYTFQVLENLISFEWGGPSGAIPHFKNLVV